MKTVSMMTTAIDIIGESNGPVKFAELWAKVKEALEITPEEEPSWISSFYTDLSLDARFCILPNNTWDLSSRHTSEEIHDIDVTTVEEESDEGKDAEDIEEDKQYNQFVHGETITTAKTTSDSSSDEENSDDETAKHEDGSELLGMKNENNNY